MSNTTDDSGRLNQAAAHDTSLYDPAIHDNQIVTLYDTTALADVAMQTLVRAGFPAGSMQVMARDSVQPGDQAGAEDGLWASVKSLFVPDEKRTIYNTAIARGHAMLVVMPTPEMDRQHLVQTIAATGPLDFDAKLEAWRQAGYDTTGDAAGAPTSNVATAGHAVDAGMNIAGRTPGNDGERR